jgi:hypothetical protein
MALWRSCSSNYFLLAPTGSARGPPFDSLSYFHTLSLCRCNSPTTSRRSLKTLARAGDHRFPFLTILKIIILAPSAAVKSIESNIFSQNVTNFSFIISCPFQTHPTSLAGAHKFLDRVACYYKKVNSKKHPSYRVLFAWLSNLI